MDKSRDPFVAQCQVGGYVTDPTVAGNAAMWMSRFLDTATDRNGNPLTAAGDLFASVPGLDCILVRWTYSETLTISVVMARTRSGSARIISSHTGGPGPELESDLPDAGKVLFGITATVLRELEYGPRQVVQWIASCQRGPSNEQARAERDAREAAGQPPDDDPRTSGNPVADRWDSMMRANGNG